MPWFAFDRGGVCGASHRACAAGRIRNILRRIVGANPIRAPERAAGEASRRGVETTLLPVEMAAIRALRDDKEGAIVWLRRTYDRGWRVRESNLMDPIFAAHREDGRFREVMARIETDVLRMRRYSTELRDLLDKTLPPPAAPAK
jgi:hypothetical protein